VWVTPTYLYLYWEIVVLLLYIHPAPYNLIMHVSVKKFLMSYLRWCPY